jgi:hypothetical protein
MSAGAMLALTAGATLTLLATPWAVTGCQTHQCDATWVPEGTIASPGAGGVGTAAISPDGTEIVWDSSPVYGQWLYLGPNYSLDFAFPLNLPDPYACQPWPAPVPPPTGWIALYASDAGSDGITPASGQPLEFTGVQGSDGGIPGGFVVINGSCQGYYVLVEAHFPLPATPCPGTAGDGGADDAATE